MKPSFLQIIGGVLCAISLFMLVPLPNIDELVKPIKPLDPSLYMVQSQVKTAMNGPTAKQDAVLLEGVLRAAANCFVLDEQRPAPYYKTGEDMKWAIRSIGDLSHPLGWKMKERYPTLPGVLASYMESKLGTDVKDKEALVREMRNLADVLASV